MVKGYYLFYVLDTNHNVDVKVYNEDDIVVSMCGTSTIIDENGVVNDMCHVLSLGVDHLFIYNIT